ncbi:TPA: DUF2534 family protein [Salmonella enterica]|uniref:DUF2534 family protein n=2 Tax=Salmonella enterica TaxID=28901 RepID=A0A5V3YGY8_SALER|nr:DUF2534 family protein [Salmonella enterica subsp. enterica serovar Dahomey]EAS9163191.1 DUF2534 family protein [Salmonella enterica]ECG2271392.1 DUF2534 family protein [Salmonella enterica subsp. enterica serovar Eastbourne]ECH9563364.1 DUF2534 family protein [Salmonella enterica subsp. salamae]ECI0839995.1 DUF2534 family protein [Salmonella enterica subsp. diarizonae]EDX3148133.1 DUF2534 family protein [Salmonella enterica subsp. diarizonae serovar 61:l,v:1,5,7]MML56792.1 DUF2534 family 
MVKEKLKTRNGKRFLLSVAVVFIIAATVMTRATIGGVIWQYHIELSDWTLSMYMIQSAMIFVYSVVFTVLFSIPLGIFFLSDDKK